MFCHMLPEDSAFSGKRRITQEKCLDFPQLWKYYLIIHTGLRGGQVHGSGIG